MINKILVSQQQPIVIAPYEALSAKYGVKFDFIPFFKIEPVTAREFRAQHINILDYSAVIFSSRTTIDAFFRLSEELRIKIPETMKYFCTTEAVAMYLQKHIIYRKRKIHFGTGLPSSVVSLIGSKHKNEKFLITTSDSALVQAFEAAGYSYTLASFVKPVSQDLKSLKMSDYDMLVLYNKSDLKSLYENFPEFQQNDLKLVVYGKSALNAIEEVGLKIAISAPTPAAPSVAKAIELYLEKNQ